MFHSPSSRTLRADHVSGLARARAGGLTRTFAGTVALALRGALLAVLLTACRVGGQGPSPAPLPRISAEAASARGVDLATLQSRLDGAVRDAVRDGAFPGAIAVVGSKDGILAMSSGGQLDANDPSVPNERTIWDLASLTKVIGMTSAMERLVQGGKVDLEAPVQRYLPDWTGPGKDQVRVRHLLTHSAGLPSWRPLYKEATTPAQAMALVLATQLDTIPGARMVYSDLGAILLGEIVRRVSGAPLDVFVTREVFAPLGMRETGWRPAPSLKPRIAPTEIDPWRQRHLRGEVHDENAYALGGMTGHAGLFSTAADLTRLARMYLGYGQLDGVRVLDSTTIARFTSRPESSLSNRALGWEKPNGSNSAGHRMSPAAFGHTGFTGTSVWIDPGNDIFVILLTNRVNPTRENRKIGQVRIAVADAVMGALQGCAAGASLLECPAGGR
ncbi:MAG: serine hydrolase [Gemmatimonadaceae bacterium]|nr:serine hydrolase [Gemmatimonadaceae bacterium]